MAFVFISPVPPPWWIRLILMTEMHMCLEEGTCAPGKAASTFANPFCSQVANVPLGTASHMTKLRLLSNVGSHYQGPASWQARLHHRDHLRAVDSQGWLQAWLLGIPPPTGDRASSSVGSTWGWKSLHGTVTRTGNTKLNRKSHVSSYE